MTEMLFEGYPDPPRPPDPPKLSAGQRLTLRNKAKLESGFNPGTGLPLANNGQTCGSCDHLVHRRLGSTYLKCDLTPMSGGASSDIRAHWPACISWTLRTPDAD
jgi:hypothetical protein